MIKAIYDKAIEDFSRAICLDPNDAIVYIKIGDIYRKKGMRDRAIADYSIAIAVNPNLAVAYNKRGIAYHLNLGTTASNQGLRQGYRAGPGGN